MQPFTMTFSAPSAAIYLKPLAVAAAFLLAPMASAELEIGGSGANTIQARFEAFSACTQARETAADEAEASCDDEAQALRDMIGPRYVSSDGSMGAPARDVNMGMKETVTD